ncbi:hypothetical protein [Ulvibacter antarcticus]|nr:hypothetical protein [Ulvibacter antarcticus]
MNTFLTFVKQDAKIQSNVGSRKLEVGSWKLGVGSWKWEAGSWE